MNAQEIIKKYHLIAIERNGKQGVQPLSGKPTVADIEFIKSHKDEIMSILNAPKPEPKKVVLTAADIARNKVDELEAKYRYIENHNDSNADVIIARNAYEKALSEWQTQYPAEASKTTRVHYNEGATNNPWTN